MGNIDIESSMDSIIFPCKKLFLRPVVILKANFHQITLTKIV